MRHAGLENWSGTPDTLVENLLGTRVGIHLGTHTDMCIAMCMDMRMDMSMGILAEVRTGRDQTALDPAVLGHVRRRAHQHVARMCMHVCTGTHLRMHIEVCMPMRIHMCTGRNDQATMSSAATAAAPAAPHALTK